MSRRKQQGIFYYNRTRARSASPSLRDVSVQPEDRLADSISLLGMETYALIVSRETLSDLDKRVTLSEALRGQDHQPLAWLVSLQSRSYANVKVDGLHGFWMIGQDLLDVKPDCSICCRL